MSNDVNDFAADLSASVGLLSKKVGQAIEVSAYRTRKHWKQETRVPKGTTKSDFHYAVAHSSDEHSAEIEGTESSKHVSDTPDRAYVRAQARANEELQKGIGIAIDQVLAELGL